MGLREEFERYREKRAREVKQEHLRIEAETEKLKADKLEVQQGEFRLSDDPPTNDACPECFFHGRPPSSLRPVPSDTRNDRFRCEACGYEVEVEI